MLTVPAGAALCVSVGVGPAGCTIPAQPLAVNKNMKTRQAQMMLFTLFTGFLF
jgi:hypothetical protein